MEFGLHDVSDNLIVGYKKEKDKYIINYLSGINWDGSNKNENPDMVKPFIATLTLNIHPDQDFIVDYGTEEEKFYYVNSLYRFHFKVVEEAKGMKEGDEDNLPIIPYDSIELLDNTK